MNVVLASFGTHGDLRPFVALAHRLRAEGHQATLCGPPDHAPLAAAWAIPFVPAGEPYAALLPELEAGLQRVFAGMARQVPAQFHALAPLVEAADVVLSGSMEYATASLAEHFRKPRRAVLLSPAFVPASGQAMPLMGLFGAPRWVNRLSWWLTDLASSTSIARLIDTERKRLGLGPVGSCAAHLCGEEVWVPFPEALGRVDGPQVRVVPLPPWRLPAEVLPPALEAFLGAGAPPLFVGLGSMPAPQLTPVFLGAAARLGLRLVAGVPDPRAGTETVHFLRGPVSHEALFPRCAALVHHGGAGTTVAALDAGRPQVVLPHVADQLAHARWLEAAGLGVSAKRKGLTEVALAEAIAAAMARAPGPPLAREDGTAAAVLALAERLGAPAKPR